MKSYYSKQVVSLLLRDMTTVKRAFWRGPRRRRKLSAPHESEQPLQRPLELNIMTLIEEESDGDEESKNSTSSHAERKSGYIAQAKTSPLTAGSHDIAAFDRREALRKEDSWLSLSLSDRTHGEALCFPSTFPQDSHMVPLAKEPYDQSRRSTMKREDSWLNTSIGNIGW